MTSPNPQEGGKHTPGPWHVDPTAPEAFYQDVNVLRHSGLSVAVALHNGDITPAEVAANARLIAAAPALLEALQWVMSAHGEQLHDAFDAAHKAIAQATGGENGR